MRKPLTTLVIDAVRSHRRDVVRILGGEHQLVIVLGREPFTRDFAIAPILNKSYEWPLFVTPIPPPSETTGGSWECRTVEEVLSALEWPDRQPTMRIASVAEIRALSDSAL